MGPVGFDCRETLAALAALRDGFGQVVQLVRLQGSFVSECLRALLTLEDVHGALPVRVIAPPGVDFSEVDLQGLGGLEVLVAALLPAQVPRTARRLFQFQVSQLRLVGVQVLDVGEGTRAGLAAELLALGLVRPCGAALRHTCNTGKHR